MASHEDHPGYKGPDRTYKPDLSDRSYTRRIPRVLSDGYYDEPGLRDQLDEIIEMTTETIDKTEVVLDGYILRVEEGTDLDKAHETVWPSSLGERRYFVTFGQYKNLANRTSRGADYIRKTFKQKLQGPLGTNALDIQEGAGLIRTEAEHVRNFLDNYLGDVDDTSEHRTLELFQDWSSNAIFYARSFRNFFEAENSFASEIPNSEVDQISKDQAAEFQVLFRAKVNALNKDLERTKELLNKEFGSFTELYHDRFLGPALRVRLNSTKGIEKLATNSTFLGREAAEAVNPLNASYEVLLSDQMQRNQIFNDHMKTLLDRIYQRDRYVAYTEQLQSRGRKIKDPFLHEEPDLDVVSYFQEENAKAVDTSPDEPTNPFDPSQIYAEDIHFTPAGSISASDVQAALEELDVSKSDVGHSHPLTDLVAPPSLLNGRISNLKVSGHSLMDERGIGVPAIESAAQTVARLLGLSPGRVQNIAVSGGAVRQNTGPSSYATTLQFVNPGQAGWPYSPDGGLAMIMFGTNDAILGVGDDPDTSWQGKSYKAGMRTVIARYLASSVYENTASKVTYTGSWVQTTHDSDKPEGSGSSSHRTSTVGDRAKFTTPDDWEGGKVDIGLIGGPQDAGATYRVWLDGTPVLTGSTAGFSGGFDFYTGDIATVTTDEGEHEIELEMLSSVDSGDLICDYFSLRATPTPVVICIEMPLPSAPAGPWVNIDQTVVDQYNKWLDEVIDEFDDPAVAVARIDKLLDANPSYHSTDGLHFNARGATIVANSVIDTVNNLVQTNMVPVTAFSYAWDDERDAPLNPRGTRVHVSDGATQFSIVDTFERDDTITDGLSAYGWTVYDGIWGIARNQAYLVQVLDDNGTTDNFDRTSNPNTIGSDWTNTVGIWGINGDGQAKLMTAEGTRDYATFDTGYNDHWVEVELGSKLRSGVDDQVGLVARYVGASNHVRALWLPSFGTVALFKVVAGVSTLIGSGVLFSQDVGAKLRLIIKGDTATLVSGSNGAVLASGDVSAISPSSVAGLTSWNKTGPTFESFTYGETTLDTRYNYLTAVRDLGESDGAIEFTVGDIRTNFYGACFRWQDPKNFCAIYASASYGGWVLGYVENGVLTSDKLIPFIYNGPGTRVVVEFSGTTIKVRTDERLDAPLELRATHTLNKFTSATHVGLMARRSTWQDEGEQPVHWEQFGMGSEWLDIGDGDALLVPSESKIYTPYSQGDGGWPGSGTLYPSVIDGGSA